MRCPSCGSHESKVVDSRPSEENNSIRRRRECLDCQTRYTTYEFIDVFQPVVLKKDGSKEYFDKNKLLSGLIKACEKRPVDAEAIANGIESDLLNSLCKEISSAELGEIAMEKLKEFDAVAYVRFASVHREFKDAVSFMEELKNIIDKEDC